MKQFTSKTVRAYEVMKDDWIRIAGTMYRVESTENGWVTTHTHVIRCKNASGDPLETYTLMVPRHAKMKIHNQK